jgi:phage recombination protein Bet
MENALAIAEMVNEKKLIEFLDVMGISPKLTEQEKSQFLNIAILNGLNPFKREIFCTVYGEGQYKQLSIITGYEVYIKRAERSGQLNGWNATTSGSVATNDLKAIVTIYRKDREHPFVWEVFYEECVQKKKDGTPTQFWNKANFMTKKVCISQAFRLCFSDELGGMPYTSDEMPQQEIQDIPHVEVKIEPKKVFTLNERQFQKALLFTVNEIDTLRKNLEAIENGDLIATSEQTQLLINHLNKLENE